MKLLLLTLLLLPALAFAAPTQCVNGLDDNANTLIDWPIDPACLSATDNLEQGLNLVPDPVWAHSWTPVDPGLQYTQYAVKMSNAAYSDLPAVRAQLLAMPVGQRVIQDFDLTQISGYTPIIDDPEDYCTDPQDGTKHRCIFWDHGVEKRKPRYEALFKYLKDTNTPLDIFVQDFEVVPVMWAPLICPAGNPGNDINWGQREFSRFVNDIRFEPIYNALKETAFDFSLPWSSICAWRLNDNYIYWNSVIKKHRDNYITKMINDPLRIRFPNAFNSNWAGTYQYVPYALTDVAGHENYLAGPGYVAENEQGAIFYGDAITPQAPYPVTVFNSLRLNVFSLYGMRKQSTMPVLGWVPNLNYSGTYQNNGRYYEMLYHTMTAGVVKYFYWNLVSTNSTAFDNALKEFNKLAGFKGRTSIIPDTLDWTSDYLLTCLEVGVRRVCRFTPESTAVYVQTSKSLTITTPTKQLVFAKGARYKPDPASLGAWVIQPKRAATVVVTPALP